MAVAKVGVGVLPKEAVVLHSSKCKYKSTLSSDTTYPRKKF